MKRRRNDACCDRNGMTVIRFGKDYKNTKTRNGHFITSWQQILLEKAERISSIDRERHRASPTLVGPCTEEHTVYLDECSSRKNRQSLFTPSTFNIFLLLMRQSERTPQKANIQQNDCSLQLLAGYIWVCSLDMFVWTVSNVFWLIEYIILLTLIACQSTAATYVNTCVACLLEFVGARIAKVIVWIDRLMFGQNHHQGTPTANPLRNHSKIDHPVDYQEAMKNATNLGRQPGNNFLIKKRYEDVDDIANNIHMRKRLFTRLRRRSLDDRQLARSVKIFPFRKNVSKHSTFLLIKD
jgi:hypothetical protein